MAHVTTKKLLLAGVFALSGAFVLASCDNISAVPANYETPIIMKGEDAFDDEDNKLGKIYDALASNKNEKVVAALLEKIAEKEFGTYAELKECFNADGTVNEEKAKAHIEKYKHQFVQDDDGEGDAANKVQLARFKYFFNDLNDRINKVIFDEISSDTYRDTINKTEFLEEKYARAKRQDNYEILGFDDNGKATLDFKEVFVDSKFQEENVRDYLTDFEKTYEDYITKKLIPQVYKDKLVEEYIIDNNYSALGRAYGRKINYVKVAYDSEDPNTAYRLANLYAETYLDVAAAKDKDVDYSPLVNWVKGFEGVTTKEIASVIYPQIAPLTYATGIEAKLDEIYGAKVEFKGVCKKTGEEYPAYVGLENYGFDDTFTYYEKTKLGEILKNYQKAVVGEATRFASDEDVAQYDEFTNKGKQSKEQGLMQKITDLALNNYADDGWYVKNDADGSLSALPDEVKNRLFNIKVSNDFDKEDWEYVEDESYFKEVQEHFYLTPASASDAKYNFILRDTSGSALYIVEILEAPSTSKLNKNSDRSYSKTSDDPFKTEEIARQIAKILGTKDTYTTNAYTAYLKLYTFVYHDTSVYDYLKETYPDLFED